MSSKSIIPAAPLGPIATFSVFAVGGSCTFPLKRRQLRSSFNETDSLETSSPRASRPLTFMLGYAGPVRRRAPGRSESCGGGNEHQRPRGVGKRIGWRGSELGLPRRFQRLPILVE